MLQEEREERLLLLTEMEDRTDKRKVIHRDTSCYCPWLTYME